MGGTLADVGCQLWRRSPRGHTDAGDQQRQDAQADLQCRRGEFICRRDTDGLLRFGGAVQLGADRRIGTEDRRRGRQRRSRQLPASPLQIAGALYAGHVRWAAEGPGKASRGRTRKTSRGWTRKNTETLISV